MIRMRTLLPLLLCLAQSAHAKEPLSPGRDLPTFEKLKTLVGSWSRKSSDGRTVGLTYELISGNTAIMERLDAGDHSMVTIYHPDGSRLMMTHYCASNNQPRMRSEPGASDKEIRFSFVDATNLKTPDDGHMKALVLHIEDDRHLTQEWTYIEKGKEVTEKFSFERKK